MNPSADESSAVSLVGRLLELVADAPMGRGGMVTLGPEFLTLVRELTFALETRSVDELEFDQSRWITAGQAAALMGCSSQWVRVLASRNGISAQRVGARWLIDRISLERRLAETATTAQPETGEPEPIPKRETQPVRKDHAVNSTDQQTAAAGQQQAAGPKQLGAADVKAMTPAQVTEALDKGQLRDYLASDNRH